MTTLRVASPHGTRAAIQPAPGCLAATVGAMLRELGRGVELSAVLDFMAGYAERLAVGKVKHRLGVIGKRQNVMGVQLAAPVPASLARIAVAFINRLAPYSQFSASPCALACERGAALPVPGPVARAGDARTAAGAVSGILVSAVEYLAACWALARLRWVAMRPATPRAVLRQDRPIRFHPIRLAAYLANLCGLGVYHVAHYNAFSPAYCAVILERMAQAFPKLEITRDDGAG